MVTSNKVYLQSFCGCCDNKPWIPVQLSVAVLEAAVLCIFQNLVLSNPEITLW